jgi:Tol biopolymer transport system component/DNA-binding winged helix-turn-helix (wHTH) protein
MSKQIKYFYEFGQFRIDTVNRRLLRDGALVPLKAKAVETLLVLVEHCGEVVEKDDLMKRLWPDSFVEESNLTQNIYMLRKALGDCGYIETVPRRGYRFAGEVKEWEEDPRDLLVIKEKSRTYFSYEEESDGPSETQSGAIAPETIPAHGGRTGIEEAGIRAHLPAVKFEPRRRSLRRHWRAVGVAATSILLMGFVAFWLYRASPPFEKVRLTKFTTTGTAVKATISPDGKYLAYVTNEAGQQSLRLRQVATGKDLLIAPPQRTEFYGLTFSHDGNYIYYVSQEMNHLGLLYQVPSLGGEPIKLMEDVDSPVTLSPDGKRLAFIRYSPSDRSIIVANVDGTGERKLSSTAQGAPFRIGLTVSPHIWIPPAWSPDGRTIACPVMVTAPDGESQNIWGFPTEGGESRPLASEPWRAVGRMEWMMDGSGLLTTAAERGADTMQQIWYVAYPSGKARKVTNDLGDYKDLSLTADGKTLVTIQSERKANIWMAPAADTSRPAQLTFTNYDGLGGLSFSPDNKLVYTLQAGGEQNLWLADLNGAPPKQLTAHAGINRQPAVSPDGRYIVFVSNRTGQQHLWGIEMDGARPQELTHGPEDTEPDFTPDGRWVIYKSVISGTGYVFRIPLNGGGPVRLTDRTSGLPKVSPNGKLIAFFYRSAPAATNKIATMPFSGGEPQLISDLPAHYGQFQWMPDGRAVAYADKQSGRGNIWTQPLDGRPPTQLTHWGPNPIFNFNLSRDGRWLAFASGTLISDVVLITDERR